MFDLGAVESPRGGWEGPRLQVLLASATHRKIQASYTVAFCTRSGVDVWVNKGEGGGGGTVQRCEGKMGL